MTSGRKSSNGMTLSAQLLPAKRRKADAVRRKCACEATKIRLW
jgi:hypothetical protein